MKRCHAHNLNEPADESTRRFGIRVSLPPGDTFRAIIGDSWESYHWFADPQARNAAMTEMAHRHRYSRIGDEPRLVLQAVDR